MPDAPSRSDPDFEQWFWNNVDDSDPDGCWLWLGATKPKGGYGLFKSDGRWWAAHRVVWEMANGQVPPGILIDHRCFTDACVRLDHLRLATHKQNAENRRGARKDSRTGARNVHFDGQKYVVRITHYGRTKQYGRFATIEQAAARAAEVRRQLFTHCDR